MRRSGVRYLGLGLLVGLAGCDLAERSEGPKADPPSAPAAPGRAPPPAPPPASEPHPDKPAPVVPPRLEPPVLGLSASAALAGLFVNQLEVTPASERPTTDHFRANAPPPGAPPRHEVTLYAVFEAPFARRIELRALDAASTEIGRSEREAPLSQAADSSKYVTLHFDARLPLERVRTFVVHVDPAPELPAEAPKAAPVVAKPKPAAPTVPAPAPEPQPLHAPRAGLVPKDP